jgi:hypothetical protein
VDENNTRSTSDIPTAPMHPCIHPFPLPPCPPPPPRPYYMLDMNYSSASRNDSLTAQAPLHQLPYSTLLVVVLVC